MQRSSEAVTCVCSKTEAPGESGEEQDEATQFCLFKPAHLSLTERERERERERRERERENSNSKTLFSKDCSLGSFRPVYQLVLAKLQNK